MKKDGNIVSYTVEELEQMRARGESRTDWARVDAMTEAELEAAIANDPDWADIPRDWYKHARPHHPQALRKEVRLRLDPDLLAWFSARDPAIRRASTPRSAPSSTRMNKGKRRKRIAKVPRHQALRQAGEPRSRGPAGPGLGSPYLQFLAACSKSDGLRG